MGKFKLDASEPSHLIALVLIVGGIIFSAYELATEPDIYVTTLFKSLALGSVYALIALGFVLIFKATEVVNFSQGALAMIGALFISFMVVDETNEKFARVENIRKFALIPKQLDHEDGELTATQKLKRSAMADAFGDLVESMY